MTSVFFTGFPGFLGSRLIPRVLARSDDDAVCLVQSKFAAVAGERAAEIVAAHPALGGRIRIVEGDITEAGLGLADPRGIASEVREIYHLAAVYDLAVEADLAQRVNVVGTENVLGFARTCDNLERHQYVSTCYVSGRYAGIFREDSLEENQRFDNHYEETKFRAEVAVQEAMREGMPTTIYRPAIVVGDARTGATQKLDGPYFLIGMIVAQGKTAVVPIFGDSYKIRFNMVPGDFVVDAIAYLSSQQASKGKVYQLADPHPLSVGELIDAVAAALGKAVFKLPMPPYSLLRQIPNIPSVTERLGPIEALAYFSLPTNYSTMNTEIDLAGTGIAAPNAHEYVPRMAEFCKTHPDVTHSAMA